MKNLPFILSAIELSESDKKVLIALTIILVILFVLIGLLGIAVKKTMEYQAKRADTFMHDVTVTHVVTTPHEFRVLGRKKNHRLYYKQSLIPFGVILLAFLIWVIYSWAANTWSENIFVSFSDLLFIWDFSDPSIYTDFFNLTIIKQWPALIHGPTFQIEHLAAYFEIPLLFGGVIAYLVMTQAFIARSIQLQRRSRDVFSKSLEGYKANEVDPSKVPPLPPKDDN